MGSEHEAGVAPAGRAEPMPAAEGRAASRPAPTWTQGLAWLLGSFVLSAVGIMLLLGNLLGWQAFGAGEIRVGAVLAGDADAGHIYLGPNPPGDVSGATVYTVDASRARVARLRASEASVVYTRTESGPNAAHAQASVTPRMVSVVVQAGVSSAPGTWLTSEPGDTSVGVGVWPPDEIVGGVWRYSMGKLGLGAKPADRRDAPDAGVEESGDE